MFIQPRDGCAPRQGDTSGKAYDANGVLCGQLSGTDVIWVAVAASLCGAVVITLATIYGIRRYRAKKRLRAVEIESPRMSTISAPLLHHRSEPFVFSQMSNHTHTSISSPALSDTASLLSSNSSNHPLSPSSEAFHFPLLSADGHLLPPAPASSRNSGYQWMDGDLSSRPLPLSPADQEAGWLPSIPLPSKQWSNDSNKQYAPVNGLFEHDASIGMSAFNSFQPQSATFHRSFSAEGEEITDVDVVDFVRR